MTGAPRSTAARSSSRTCPTSSGTARSRRASRPSTRDGLLALPAASAPTTTPSPTRRTRSSSATSGPRSSGSSRARGGATRSRRRPEGPFGVVVDQAELYRRMEEVDSFELFKLDGSPAPNGGLTIDERGKAAGSMAGAHDLDESLSASVLLENLACKASGALALEHLLRTTGLAPEDVAYAIGCGEEAVGDRYQRGGGNLAKAIAEQAGCVDASGSDVKAFCCGPVHALVVAGSLVASGVYPRVVVVAGGSLAKLGMKFSGALRHGVPVLEDVLAGIAVLVGAAGRRRARAPPRRGRPTPGRLGLGAAGRARGPRRRAARAPRPRHPRRRPLRDRAARPRDHRAGRGGQRPEPQLQADRRARRHARRAGARGARRLRAQPRPAGLLADAGPHRLRRAVAPARARAPCAPARSARPCCWRRARSSSVA